MYYSRWSTKEELESISTKIDLNTDIKESNLPFMYDEKNLYLLNNSYHTMVIGSTGSGKTQSIVLPMLRLSAKAGESFIVSDPKGENYDVTIGMLKELNYNVKVINLDKPNLGNNFNPLTLPYNLYKEGNKDKAMELIENIASYLLKDKTQVNSDPFWENTAIDLFTGLTLYLFENAKEEEINLCSIHSLSNSLVLAKNNKEFVEKLPKNSQMYVNLSGTLLAPPETKGSILSVFNQKMKLFVSRENLINLLCNNDIDLKDIVNKKTALFLIGGNNTISSYIIPLIVSQIYEVVDLYGNKEKNINILLDEFEILKPITDFYKVLTVSRSLKLRFYIFIKSYLDIKNQYGKEDTETLKQCFQNIVYLMSTDIETLEEISKYCGNKEIDKPLISVEELKHLDTFEAVIISLRLMPIRTKLLPDYEVKYNYDTKKYPIPERKSKEIKIYNM